VQRRLTLSGTKIAPRLLRRSVASIAAITLLYVFVLPPLSGTIMSWPEGWRITAAFLLAAPLAFAMGMPFSLGLSTVQQAAPWLLPWAWGINGCASVVSAVLATLLAIEFGFSAVVGLAVALYLAAAAVWRGPL
jgi:multisubunit Na+/H+ antiporter MnhB subunit